MRQYFRSEFLALLLALAFTGCDKADLFSAAPGQYQGTVLAKRTGLVQQTLVASEITARSKQDLVVADRPLDGSAISTLSLHADSSTKVWLMFSDWGNTRVLLKGVSQNCFASDPKTKPGEFAAEMCFNGVDLTVDLNRGVGADAYTLSISRVNSGNPPVAEIPQSYTIAQIFKRAMNQNFDSPIQFEHVVQAKLKTQSAYLGLIPHISVNDVLNIAAFNLLGYLKTIGDLVPFLFPARWLAVREAQYRSEAEFDAWILSKADAANVAEGLSYSVLRDVQVLATIELERKGIEQARDRIKQRERGGLMQANASDDVESILNSIDRGTAVLRSSLIEEKMALAQSAGFFNYSAITDVQVNDDVPIDNLQPYDAAMILRLGSLALDRSYERRQMSALIQASRIGEKERYFQWLDPSASQDSQLGISLIPYIKMGGSQTQELIAKRTKTEVGLVDMVARNATTANQYLESYQLARTGFDIQNRRVTRHLGNMETGINFSMSDLTNALQEKLKAAVELIDIQYAYYIVQGNLNRSLLTGPYAWLPTDRGQPGWIISAGADPR